MMTQPVGRRLMFLGVRRVFWLVLATALLLALALPAVTLWHASTSALHVQACLYPAAPRAGEPAWLVVAPTTTADRTTLEGPWATIVTRWDMVSMSMGTQHRTIAGSEATHGAFAVPLDLGMAGEWWAQVALSTPGRPLWQQSVRFAVSAFSAGQAPQGPSGASSPASTSLRALSPCAHAAT